MTLRLVKDAPKVPRRHGHRAPPVLSKEQERVANAAIRGLAVKRFGSLTKMSQALGLHPDSVKNALGRRGRVTAEMVLRVALVTRTPVEAMITPGPREAGS